MVSVVDFITLTLLFLISSALVQGRHGVFFFFSRFHLVSGHFVSWLFFFVSISASLFVVVFFFFYLLSSG
jgi:hypothetical protein